MDSHIIVSLIIYTIILFGASISAYVCSKSKNTIEQFASLIMSFLFLFIPAAIRYGVGVDYFRYVESFNNIANGYGWAFHNMDTLYVFLSYEMAKIGFNAQWNIAVIAFITYVFLFMAIPKKYLYIAIPIYIILCYHDSLFFIRQALCAAGAVFSTRLLIEHKYIRSFLLLIILTGFHLSTVFYFPIFILFLFFRINRPKHLIPITIILAFAALTFFNANFLWNTFAAPLFGITTYDFEVSGGMGYFARVMLVTMILFYVSLIMKKNESTFTNIVLLTSPLFIVSNIYTLQFQIVGRLLIAFNYLLIFVFIFIKSTKNKYRKILLLSLYTCFALLLYYYPIFKAPVKPIGNDGTLIYRTIFQKNKIGF